MSMQLLVFQVLNGLGIGMIYFLLSVGLTLIFGLMRFVNFAHGAFYLVAAYMAFAITRATGSIWVALVAAPLAVALLAVIVERVLLRHTYRMPHEVQILITFAVALLIQEMVIVIFGPLGQNVPCSRCPVRGRVPRPLCLSGLPSRGGRGRGGRGHRALVRGRAHESSARCFVLARRAPRWSGSSASTSTGCS
jgi:MFS family permease